MLCPSCEKNEVTVHYTEVVDGQAVEYHLCEECARKKGLALTPSDAMAELISSLAAERQPAEDEDLACGNCGLTLKDLRSGGRLGCGECCRVFSAHLESLLKTLHRGTRHTGKRPGPEGKAPGPRGDGDELAQLKREVEAAVAAEDYEQAARLRDRIEYLTRGEDHPPRGK